MGRLQNPPLPPWTKQARQEVTLRAQGCFQPLDRSGRRATQRAEGQHNLQNFLNASVENGTKYLSPTAEWVKRHNITLDGVLQDFVQPGKALKMTEPKEIRNQG